MQLNNEKLRTRLYMLIDEGLGGGGGGGGGDGSEGRSRSPYLLISKSINQHPLISLVTAIFATVIGGVILKSID